MAPELEKAKKALSKYFCITELQVNEARLEGKEIMEKEDMEFILSFKGEESNTYFHFKTEDEVYDSDALLSSVKEAVSKELQGMFTYTRLQEKDLVRLKEAGYLVKFEGPGMIGDEIYFSEDALIRAEISSFQHLFGCLNSLSEPLFSFFERRRESKII